MGRRDMGGLNPNRIKILNAVKDEVLVVDRTFCVLSLTYKLKLLTVVQKFT